MHPYPQHSLICSWQWCKWIGRRVWSTVKVIYASQKVAQTRIALWKHLQVSMKETCRLWTLSITSQRCTSSNDSSQSWTTETLGDASVFKKSLRLRTCCIRNSENPSKFHTEEITRILHRIKTWYRNMQSTGLRKGYTSWQQGALDNGMQAEQQQACGKETLPPPHVYPQVLVLYKAAVMSLAFRTAGWGCVQGEDTYKKGNVATHFLICNENDQISAKSKRLSKSNPSFYE